MKAKWNYLGNEIIERLTKNITTKKFFRLDKNKMNAFPENKYYENSSLTKFQQYQQFYFQKKERDIHSLFNKVKGIILLHNNLDSFKYKVLSQKKFLSTNILLSRLLTEILKNSL